MNVKSENIINSNLVTADVFSGLRRFKNKAIPIYLQLSADILAITLSVILQYYIRFETELFGTIKPADEWLLFSVIVVVNIIWILIFAVNGLYKNLYEISPFEEIFTFTKIVFFIGILGVLAFLFFGEAPPRMLLFIHCISLVFFLIFFRTIARRIQRHLRKIKIINYNAIIIGKSDRIKDITKSLNSATSWGYRPVAFLALDKKQELPVGYDKYYDLSNLEDIIKKYKPDSVIIGSKTTKESILFKIINTASDMGVRVKIENSLYSLFTGQARTNNLYGIPFIEVNPELMKSWQLFLKRTFDIAFSFLVLLIGLPIWLIIALFITLDSKGGVFFTQQRVGKNGKLFKMYKFRTMRPPKANEEAKWTKVNDNRVTKFGKFLRKSHLDEVPQFLNCLLGDMSIVGPRPEQKPFVDEFTEKHPAYPRRHIIRPGLTGWWQIKYEVYDLTNEEIENRLKDDFYYIENMSLKLDIEIIIRTVWCVLKGHGQT